MTAAHSPTIILDGTGPGSRRTPNRVADEIERGRRRWFVGVGLLLVISFNGQWHVGPDSAAYRALGHQLATTGRYYFRDDVPGLDEYHNKQGTLYPGLP